MQKWTSRLVTGAVLAVLLWIALPASAQDTLSAQVLRLLDRANTWTQPQTFATDVTITGTCTGCSSSAGTVTHTGALAGHGVVVGNGGADILTTSTGTSGQLFVSGGAAADPAFATRTGLGQTPVVCAFSSVATGTTRIPIDDTIPQITEGDEYMTCAITPTNASSTLIITGIVNGASSAGASNNWALFQDATAAALAAGPMSTSSAASWHFSAPFFHSMTAGTTSSTTFRLRAATNSGTFTFNGVAGGRLYGATPKAWMMITEYLP